MLAVDLRVVDAAPPEPETAAELARITVPVGMEQDALAEPEPTLVPHLAVPGMAAEMAASAVLALTPVLLLAELATVLDALAEPETAVLLLVELVTAVEPDALVELETAVLLLVELVTAAEPDALVELGTAVPIQAVPLLAVTAAVRRPTTALAKSLS